MVKMETNKKYTHYELLEMLPDYVFNRLKEDEVMIFENSTTGYPDIQQEIADVRAVFDRVEKIDFDRIIDHRTKNLSYKVNQRLNKKKSMFGFSGTIRYLVPTLAVFILVFLYFQPGKFKNLNNFSEIAVADINTENPLLVNNKDISYLLDSGMDIMEVFDATNSLNSGSTGSHFIDIPNSIVDDNNLGDLNDILMDEVFKHGNEKTSMIKIQNNDYDNDIYDNLNELNEDDIQELLKEIENAKIIS